MESESMHSLIKKNYSVDKTARMKSDIIYKQCEIII